MKLSPINVKTQEFTKGLRGYNVEEVRAFLEKLSKELEELIKEHDNYKEEVEELKEKVAEFRKIEKNLQDTLLKAQESSTKSFESTKKQTNVMVKEAELKASQILDKAKESANEIRNAVITLREEKDLIISKLKAIVNTQSGLLEGKLERAGEEPEKPKKQEAQNNFNIDVNGIVDKLL